jgi:hypothetical protein
MGMLDLRRTDLRTTTLENPYWMTSAEINKDCDDTEAVLFSFPASGGWMHTRGLFLITAICCEVITAFSGGTITLDIGYGTIPLETTTTGGIVTETDVDEYIDNTEITEGTAGIYFPAATDFVTALAAGTFVAPVRIDPVDADVPVIYAKLLSDATITAGAARVHALVHRVPLVE